jgi:hypothetical protein
VDGLAEVSVTEPMPPTDQVPIEEYVIVLVIRQAGHDPVMLNRLKPKEIDPEFQYHTAA